MLAVVGSAVDHRPCIRQPHQRLVVVDHHRPAAKGLPPEPGVGGFSRTASGGEQVCGTVQRNGGAVNQQGVIGRHPVGDLPVHRKFLQISLRKGTGGNALPLILPGGLVPFPGDIRRGDPNGKIRISCMPVGGTVGVDIRVQALDGNAPPGNPVGFCVHGWLLFCSCLYFSIIRGKSKGEGRF